MEIIIFSKIIRKEIIKGYKTYNNKKHIMQYKDIFVYFKDLEMSKLSATLNCYIKQIIHG